MNFLPESLEKYVENHTSPEPEILKRLNRETHAHVMMPQMLSGHLQGRFLKMLTAMIQPKQVLEIGTFTGYSAISIAEGLNDGILHTIDINEELHSMVKQYIEASGAGNKIKTYVGNAMEIIPAMKVEFDMVFIDADKKNYSNYYDLVFNKVRKGGYIIADNVLWSGKVVESGKQDVDTKSIMAYNDKVNSDTRVENVMVPIRDGLMIARKLL